jgi:hypothetical protein
MGIEVYYKKNSSMFMLSPWSLFFRIQKKHFKYLKNCKKNLGVDNAALYRRAKYQLKIHYIRDYTKIINLVSKVVNRATFQNSQICQKIPFCVCFPYATKFIVLTKAFM